MRGIPIILHVKKQTGTDPFGAPVYEDATETVENVLIGEPQGDQVVNELQLHGKHLAYTLGIPKGDEHIWNDAEVEFFGERFRAYGDVTQGIDELVPLSWNKKVKVERYE